MSSEYPTSDFFAMPTSGDVELDAQRAEAFLIHEKRQIEGICPNGCAPMILDDPHNRHCPKCKFHGWSNVPFKTI